MFCPNCGTKNADGAVFCENCGERLTAPETAPEIPAVDGPAVEAPASEAPVSEAPAAEAPSVEEPAAEAPAADAPTPAVYTQAQYQAPPQYQPPMAAYYAPAAGYSGEKSSPARTSVKRVLSSPLFLVGAILFTLSAILSFIADLTFKDKIRITYDNFFVEFGTDPGSAVSTLISFALVAVGIWLIYFACLKKDDTCSPAGFVMLKVLSIISLVALCIAAAGVIVVFVVLLLVGKDFQIESVIKFGDSALDREMKSLFDGLLSVEKWVWAVAFGIAIVLIALLIIFFAKLSGTLNAAKRTAKTGEAAKGVSLFVAVGCFIIAACSLSAASALFAIGLIFHGIATVVSAAAFIFFGIVVLNLKKAMKAELAKPREVPAFGGAPAGVPGSVCPRCGATLAPDFKLCPHCGLPRQN